MLKDGQFGTGVTSVAAAIGVALVSVMVVASQAQATDLRFCFNDWPPYVFSEDGGAEGISVDITRRAAAVAGLEVSFEELPWNRCLEMVRQGAFDGVLDAAERPEFLQGPASYSVYTNTFWVHEDSPVQRFAFSAFEGGTVGLVSGYSYPKDLLDSLDQVGARIEYAVDDRANIRKLAFGRVGAIVADFANTLQITREKDLNIRPLSPTHSRDRLYLSMHAARAVEHKALNDAIEQLFSTGVVEQVYRDHIGIGLSEMGLE